MKKVLIVYFTLKGHTEQLAYCIADGVKTAGAEAEIKEISEIETKVKTQEESVKEKEAKINEIQKRQEEFRAFIKELNFEV